MPPGIGYYRDAPNALAGGALFMHDLERSRLQRNALRALIGRFGPEAADPESFALLQSIEQSDQLFPYTLENTERSTAARRALVDRFGATAGDPVVMAAEDTALNQQRNILHRAVSALRMVRDRNGDLPGALRQFGTILSRIGMPEDELTSLQQQIITNPDTLDELDVLLRASTEGRRSLSGGQPFYNEQGELVFGIPMDDGSVRIVPGLTPATAAQAEERLRQGAERLGLGWANLDWDRVREYLPARQQGVQLFPTEDGRVVADIVPGSPAEQDLIKTLQEMDADDRKFLQAYGATLDHANAVATNAQRALDYFESARGGILLQSIRAGTQLVPGTDAHNARQALEAVKNNIGIDELQRMRQSSPTGGAMGNVSDRDIELLTGVFGRLETANDPQRLVEDLRNLLAVYGRIVNFAQQDAEDAQYRMQLRQQRRGASFGPQPRPTPGSAPPAATPPPSGEPTLQELLDRYAPRPGGR